MKNPGDARLFQSRIPEDALGGSFWHLLRLVTVNSDFLSSLRTEPGIVFAAMLQEVTSAFAEQLFKLARLHSLTFFILLF